MCKRKEQEVTIRNLLMLIVLILPCVSHAVTYTPGAGSGQQKYCAYAVGDYLCMWCTAGPNGATQPGNCNKSYAGCVNGETPNLALNEVRANIRCTADGMCYANCRTEELKETEYLGDHLMRERYKTGCLCDTWEDWTYSCLDGYVGIYDDAGERKCVCRTENGLVEKNGKCVPKLICPDGYVEKDDQCIKEIVCPDGFEPNPDNSLNGMGECIQTCPLPFMYIEGSIIRAGYPGYCIPCPAYLADSEHLYPPDVVAGRPRGASSYGITSCYMMATGQPLQDTLGIFTVDEACPYVP